MTSIGAGAVRRSVEADLAGHIATAVDVCQGIGGGMTIRTTAINISRIDMGAMSAGSRRIAVADSAVSRDDAPVRGHNRSRGRQTVVVTGGRGTSTDHTANISSDRGVGQSGQNIDRAVLVTIVAAVIDVAGVTGDRVNPEGGCSIKVRRMTARNRPGGHTAVTKRTTDGTDIPGCNEVILALGIVTGGIGTAIIDIIPGRDSHSRFIRDCGGPVRVLCSVSESGAGRDVSRIDRIGSMTGGASEDPAGPEVLTVVTGKRFTVGHCDVSGAGRIRCIIMAGVTIQTVGVIPGAIGQGRIVAGGGAVFVRAVVSDRRGKERNASSSIAMVAR